MKFFQRWFNNKMEFLKTMWSFVCEHSNEHFLDCEIITSTARLLTNKCFLTLSRKLLCGLSFTADENQTIVMSAFSPEEIKTELFGFAKVKHSEEKEFSSNTDWKQDMESEWKFQDCQTSKDNPVQKSYQCEECGKVFVKAKPLWMHKFQVHNKKNYQCKQCMQKFKTNGNLINHIQQVHNEIKFKCIKCSKQFSQKGNMLRHSNLCKSLTKS